METFEPLAPGFHPSRVSNHLIRPEFCRIKLVLPAHQPRSTYDDEFLVHDPVIFGAWPITSSIADAYIYPVFGEINLTFSHDYVDLQIRILFSEPWKPWNEESQTKGRQHINS